MGDSIFLRSVSFYRYLELQGLSNTNTMKRLTTTSKIRSPYVGNFHPTYVHRRASKDFNSCNQCLEFSIEVAFQYQLRSEWESFVSTCIDRLLSYSSHSVVLTMCSQKFILRTREPCNCIARKFALLLKQRSRELVVNSTEPRMFEKCFNKLWMC